MLSIIVMCGVIKLIKLMGFMVVVIKVYNSVIKISNIKLV